jgi:hypothetical protein
MGEALVHLNLLGKLGVRRRLRPWNRLAGTRLLFQWANDELKRLYQAGLEASAEDPAVADLPAAPLIQDNRRE